jgi:AcrR family transcriptional regulator
LDTKKCSQMFPKRLIVTSIKNAALVEKKHQQIVERACKIFFEKGYHPTTIRDIAKACDMSMGQLYQYIHSKDDVLYLVHKHMHQVWYDYIKKSNLEQIDDPLQKFREALYHSFEFIIENKKLIQFVYTESKYLGKRHLKVVLEMDYNNVIGFWHGLLEEVNTRKAIKGDLDILASWVVFQQVFMPLRGWTLPDKGKMKIMDFLYEVILRGLGIAGR